MPHCHVGTGTFEDSYLGFQTYASAGMMHICVIYLSMHHGLL